MTTPPGPKPTTGRILEPASFGVKPFKGRPIPESGPDEYGQVNNADRDHSRLGQNPNLSAQAHLHSDVNSSVQALHHTLGMGRNQAAQGNHSHDGITGRKIGPLEMDPANPGKTRPQLTLAATAADIRTFLHQFFEFRDV